MFMTDEKRKWTARRPSVSDLGFHELGTLPVPVAEVFGIAHVQCEEVELIDGIVHIIECI